MQFAENEARRRGFFEMRLYTHEKMIENVAMYASSGWTETGRVEQAGYSRRMSKQWFVGEIRDMGPVSPDPIITPDPRSPPTAGRVSRAEGGPPQRGHDGLHAFACLRRPPKRWQL
jgi:hypothetical protein